MNALTPELRNRVTEDVENALREDMGSGDLTAELVPAEQHAVATVIVREEAVICGQPWFDEVFALLDTEVAVDWRVAEGSLAHAGDIVCEITGPARAILTGERAALNFLQTLSATASSARAFSLAAAGTGAVILDTRKTIPGLRLAQKYAVRTGGAQNHRTGLYDGILIKENHIAAAGGVAAAVSAALSLSDGVLVEVEVENLDEANAAMQAGAERLLLDNFTPELMREAVRLRDQSKPQVTLEASGGVDLDSVAAIAASGVDFISVGSLTKDIRAIDFSMRFAALD